MKSYVRIAMIFFTLVSFSGCGSEESATGDNLAGRTYSRTFVATLPGESQEGEYTRKMIFSATEVEDTIEGVSSNTFPYGLNGDKVNVTISAGKIQTYTLSQDRQTLTQDNDSDEIFTLETLTSLVDKL